MSILEFLTTEQKIQDEKTKQNFQYWRDVLNKLIEFVHIGSGTPESNETGSVGHIFLRTDGGASTTLYVKESGADTKVGWIAK